MRKLGEIVMNKQNLPARASQSKGFKYSLIASAIIGLSSASAYAAEEETVTTEEEELEVIQVTGQRGNLISAQNMKMDADTVMDALSAADMGSLPDRSVLEAISRLPGVAIERFAASDDPDHFGVEGGGVVVRGLTHVRSEFNGRDSFSADSGRGLSFQDVSPELMGSVEVFKNQTADMIEGGIAGTVNLNTRKAFDSAGRVFAFSADATYTDMREEFSPTFSALYSDIWETDAGRFGFLANFSHSEIQVESHGVQSGRYKEQDRDASLLVPESVRLTQKQDDKDRDGFATSLQWENNEGTLQLTAEYIKSSATLAWGENAIEWADDVGGNLLPVEGTEFDFNDDGTFENGVITSEAGWRGDGSPQRYGMQHAMVTRVRNEDSDVNDFSFNAKYNPNDNLSLNFDVQYIDSTMEVSDVSVMGATRAVVGLDLRGSGLPDVSLYGPGYDNQADYQSGTPFLDPSTSFWRSTMDHIQDNEGEEFATRLDAEYMFDNGIIKSVEVGARYSDREQTTRQSTYNWGPLSEGWTSGGNVWFADSDMPYEQVSFEDFSRGGVLTTEGGNEFLFPSLAMVQNYAGLNDAVASTREAGGGDWKPLANRDGAEGNFIGNEINQTQETNTAFYAKLNFEGDFSGMDYSANIGLRYVKLENDTAGFLSFPDDVPSGEDDILNQVLNPEQSAFGNKAAEETVASSEYTNVLPSLNFKLNLTDELLLRFGFSEAIALPSLGNLRNYVSISGQDLQVTYDPNVPDGEEPQPIYAEWERYIASSGNPMLKPMESYNYDLSLEWYFAEAGSLTASLFYKDLNNYFINGTNFVNYTNNGVTQEVQVAGPINGEEGTIQGFEVAYQQFFDALPGAFSGLGMQLNYTYIDEDGSPNAGLNDSSSDSNAAGDIAFDALPLEGLSEQNANAALLYEKYGISARIAYNWRSDYLLTTRDVITTLPIYNKANGQLDASLYWDVSDNWKLGVQGTNLNNNVTETQMQINQEGDKVSRSWFTNDRRYSLVVRATF
jgi:TonB-dependent receptor